MWAIPSLTLCLVWLATCTHAFTGIRQAHASTGLRMSASDVASSIMQKLEGTLGLKRTDYTDTLDCARFSLTSKVDGVAFTGEAGWYDETMGSKLTGVSKYSMESADKSVQAHVIQAWMGPGFLVPHMFLTVGDIGDGTCTVKTDLYPRGPYPFGSDQKYLDTYYSDFIRGGNQEQANYNPVPMPESFYARLLISPAVFSATRISEQEAGSIANAHVDKWLAFLGSAEKVDARSRAGINTRDDKLRQFAFLSKLDKYVPMFGEDGRSLAAAFTGPLAEAYIGGGS
jgi:hypothetical protein